MTHKKLPTCIFCGLPIEKYYVSHKATFIIPGGRGEAHEACYDARRHDKPQPTEDIAKQAAMDLLTA